MAQAILNPVNFVNLFGWTFDPRLDTPYIPFELFDRQRDYLLWLNQCYQDKEFGIADKCRDVGFTWLNCAFLAWAWLTIEGFKGTVGSRKVDLVDQLGNLDAILPKIRFMIDWLPDEIAPAYKPRFLLITNQTNGAIISGEGGDQMGRGGRSSIYIKDEASFIERPQLVDAAVSNNSDCVIEVSTPNGMGHPFAIRRHSGNFRTFSFDWKDDPRKTRAWYEKMKRQLDPIVFAQEVERDYSASEPGILLPRKWVLACVNYPLKSGASGARVVGYDVADEGSNKNVCVMRQGNMVLAVEWWMGDDLTQSAFKSIDFARERKADAIHFDAVGVGAATGTIYKNFAAAALGSINWKAINTGSPPTKMWWEGERRKAEDKFLNLRAELGWKLREAIRKTHAVVNEGAIFPEEELISLPDHPEFLFDLSLPVYKFSNSGKLLLESKADMKKRGIKSPDFYDALALTMVESGVINIPARAYG